MSDSEEVSDFEDYARGPTGFQAVSFSPAFDQPRQEDLGEFRVFDSDELSQVGWTHERRFSIEGGGESDVSDYPARARGAPSNLHRASTASVQSTSSIDTNDPATGVNHSRDLSGYASDSSANSVQRAAAINEALLAGFAGLSDTSGTSGSEREPPVDPAQKGGKAHAFSQPPGAAAKSNQPTHIPIAVHHHVSGAGSTAQRRETVAGGNLHLNKDKDGASSTSLPDGNARKPKAQRSRTYHPGEPQHAATASAGGGRAGKMRRQVSGELDGETEEPSDLEQLYEQLAEAEHVADQYDTGQLQRGNKGRNGPIEYSTTNGMGKRDQAWSKRTQGQGHQCSGHTRPRHRRSLSNQDHTEASSGRTLGQGKGRKSGRSINPPGRGAAVPGHHKSPSDGGVQKTPVVNLLTHIQQCLETMGPSLPHVVLPAGESLPVIQALSFISATLRDVPSHQLPVMSCNDIVRARSKSPQQPQPPKHPQSQSQHQQLLNKEQAHREQLQREQQALLAHDNEGNWVSRVRSLNDIKGRYHELSKMSSEDNVKSLSQSEGHVTQSHQAKHASGGYGTTAAIGHGHGHGTHKELLSPLASSVSGTSRKLPEVNGSAGHDPEDASRQAKARLDSAENRRRIRAGRSPPSPAACEHTYIATPSSLFPEA
eukprot:TRINITY_DN9096_c0_g2_i1.p1 TRINITY_DN9096_c0_g2~~TRINITY_DN9096_c0_g2_i1.p1  ORF type:complete len:654 (-),score=70.91 TRINITY_DN9096_c0_g2_i1:455-2416(-)